MFGAALLVFEMSTPRQALRAAGCLTVMFVVRLREQRGAAIRVRGAERVWRQALARAGRIPVATGSVAGTRSRTVASFFGGGDASRASACKTLAKQASGAAVHAP